MRPRRKATPASAAPSYVASHVVRGERGEADEEAGGAARSVVEAPADLAAGAEKAAVDEIDEARRLTECGDDERVVARRNELIREAVAADRDDGEVAVDDVPDDALLGVGGTRGIRDLHRSVHGAVDTTDRREEVEVRILRRDGRSR